MVEMCAKQDLPGEMEYLSLQVVNN